jgi:hypothetical protein
VVAKQTAQVKNKSNTPQNMQCTKNEIACTHVQNSENAAKPQKTNKHTRTPSENACKAHSNAAIQPSKQTNKQTSKPPYLSKQTNKQANKQTNKQPTKT